MADKVAVRQADIKRALAGANGAGFDIGRMEIDLPMGKITIFAKGDETRPLTPFDDWAKKHASQT